MKLKEKSSAVKALNFTAVIALTAVVFALVTGAVLLITVLVSAGLLSVFVSLGCIINLLDNVASDLSPPAMLFTGFFCVFSALALFCALYILCPKFIKRFNLFIPQ